MSKKGKQISTYAVAALGSSLVLGGIFTVLSMQTFAKADILVAAADIAPYSGVLTAEHFTTIQVSRGDKKNFEGFVSDPNQLIGKVATSAIYKGQTVKDVQFVNPEDASGVQNIVKDPNNRGLYLPLNATDALHGDMKVGGVYDFYIVTKRPNPLPGKEDNVDTVAIPLQSSYTVNKMMYGEDGSATVFMEFPKEETERYVILKNMITNGEATITAVMPNAIHENYAGQILSYSEFFGALVKDDEYMTSISQPDEKDNTEIKVENNLTTPVENNSTIPVENNNKENTEEKKEPTKPVA